MTKEEELEIKLQKFQEKYSKIFEEMEIKEKGAGDIIWHITKIPVNFYESSLGNKMGVNNSSILPQNIQDEILNIMRSVFSD